MGHHDEFKGMPLISNSFLLIFVLNISFSHVLKMWSKFKPVWLSYRYYQCWKKTQLFKLTVCQIAVKISLPKWCSLVMWLQVWVLSFETSIYLIVVRKSLKIRNVFIFNVPLKFWSMSSNKFGSNFPFEKKN